MGVAGAVLAGAGRRGVGGALGAGVRGDRGLHELPAPLRADHDGPRVTRGGQDRRGSRLPRQIAGGRPLRGPDGARDRTPRTARALLRAAWRDGGGVRPSRTRPLSGRTGGLRAPLRRRGAADGGVAREVDQGAAGRWILQRRIRWRTRRLHGQATGTLCPAGGGLRQRGTAQWPYPWARAFEWARGRGARARRRRPVERGDRR